LLLRVCFNLNIVSLDYYLAILVLLLIHRELSLLENRLILTTALDAADVRLSLLEARGSFAFCSAIRRALNVNLVLLVLGLEVFSLLPLEGNSISAFTARWLLSCYHLLLVVELRTVAGHISIVYGIGVVVLLVLSVIRIVSLFK
jgi:hypothetical protein